MDNEKHKSIKTVALQELC